MGKINTLKENCIVKKIVKMGNKNKALVKIKKGYLLLDIKEKNNTRYIEYNDNRYYLV